VAGYTVRRGGVVLDDTVAASYSDASVAPGGTYEYTVQAFDAAGNRSGQSAAVSVSVPGELPPPTGDGIALRGVSTATNADDDTVLTIPAPTHQLGDLLLATVDYRGGAEIDSVPAGWTLLRRDDNGTAVIKVTYYRVAGGAEPATYTWAFDRRPPAVGSILAYSGVSTSDPIEASSGQVNPASRSVTAPSVTTSSPGALVVGLFAVNKGATFTAPVGMAERSDVSSPGTVAYPVTGGTADVVRATAGASGAKVATSSATGQSVGQLIALRPA